MSTFNIDTGQVERGHVTAARGPDGSMEYAVTFAREEEAEEDAGAVCGGGGGTARGQGWGGNNTSLRLDTAATSTTRRHPAVKKVYPLRGLLMQIDNRCARACPERAVAGFRFLGYVAFDGLSHGPRSPRRGRSCARHTHTHTHAPQRVTAALGGRGELMEGGTPTRKRRWTGCMTGTSSRPCSGSALARAPGRSGRRPAL